MNADVKEVLDALEVAKTSAIAMNGALLINKVMSEVLDLEDFPSGPESFHSVQESEIVKAVFGSHAMGVEKSFKVFMSMIEEGILIPDMKAMREKAGQLRSDEETETEFPNVEMEFEDGDNDEE
jgi:hypothetical protein